jgi:HlyD family secretion protein
MDRDLEPQIRKKRILRRSLGSIAIIGIAVLVFVWMPRLIQPTVARTAIRIARVDAGPIEAQISASGLIVPEFEQVISSPVNARVLKILQRPGATLSRGTPILELDLNESRLAIEKLAQQIELKQNQQDKARLDLENTLISLQSQWEIKNLEHKAAHAATLRNRLLRQESLLSEERLREVELIEEKAAHELKQLEAAKQNAQASTRTSLEGLALEMKTVEGDISEARRQLELATTKSDRNGVLTWVINEEGATLQKGTVLARIADLTSFRVEATVSDVHANRLRTGMPVSVKINDEVLAGNVSRINPAVNNGVVTFFVDLVEKSDPRLRSNLRVDVLVATERKERALRIKRGPFASGEGMRDVFVVRGDTAIKTPVRFGIYSFDHFEVVQGLLEGDEVIISDMSSYQHLKEVKLK